jgi:protein subunit release factor A
MKDLEMQTFSVGGHGGGGKDTSNSGVRLIHPPSGAVGEGREHRSNTMNRQAAFIRLANSDKFKRWHKAECARRMGQQPEESLAELKARVDAEVDVQIKNGQIKIEYL